MSKPLTIGSTYRFRVVAEKDGVAWDITGGAVTVYLIAPNGTATAHAATITDGPGGIAEYLSVSADLNAAGQWAWSWTVVVGGVEQRSNPFKFLAEDSRKVPA